MKFLPQWEHASPFLGTLAGVPSESASTDWVELLTWASWPDDEVAVPITSFLFGWHVLWWTCNPLAVSNPLLQPVHFSGSEIIRINESHGLWFWRLKIVIHFFCSHAFETWQIYFWDSFVLYYTYWNLKKKLKYNAGSFYVKLHDLVIIFELRNLTRIWQFSLNQWVTA